MPLERLPSFEEWNECCTDELALFADELDVVLGDSGSKESVGDTDAETSGPQKPSGGESSPVEEDVVEEHKEIHSQELEVQDDETVGQKAYYDSIFKTASRSMKDRVSSLIDSDYWQKLCPELHINDPALIKAAHRQVLNFVDKPDRVDELREGMGRDGYFTIDAGPELPWAVDLGAMARAVRILGEAGWPPSFLLVYDEPWVMAHQMRQLLLLTTGNQQVMDWFFFHVDPSASCPGALKAGWAPHRDRGTDETARRFRADGTPEYNTVWVPFTDATPSSSCLMCVPKAHDKGYTDGDKGQNPLQHIFCSPTSFQAIRPLPCKAGSVVSFTHRLLHWGSTADPCSKDEPRMAMSFAAADPAFEKPYLDHSHLPCPAVELRVTLVAAQAICYSQNEILTSSAAAVYYHTFQAFSQEFDDGFARRVRDQMGWLETFHANKKRGSDARQTAAQCA